MASKIVVQYVTSSEFKVQENEAFLKASSLPGGTRVEDAFEFHIRRVQIKEILEIDLCAMVMAEVTEAYSTIKVPCIVEHAGLVFDAYGSYPGGLTKPMWNFLGSKFIEETQSAGRKVTARAVVGYCDGHTVQTFVGETPGRIADAPRGEREFYWDTVFIPDDAVGDVAGKTYAEIVKDKGLEYKMKDLSQSSRAMLKFLDFRRTHSPAMWSS
jgi:inosine/xanthosine triphosphate pyrophosphatase family protein